MDPNAVPHAGGDESYAVQTGEKSKVVLVYREVLLLFLTNSNNKKQQL